ncbi:hypothetical protein ABZX34_02305 [Streptomyces sp. NPDC004362]|uniref:hypothetical protein n=1 Tax=Streptomyces sp. NPDC004362 TaxID=3154456 RepID=UPI0033A46302
MSAISTLFCNGDLDSGLRHQLGQIENAVASWKEDDLLAHPEQDVIDSLIERFRVEAPVLDRESITQEPVAQGYTTVHEFGQPIEIKQTVVTLVVPFTGERDLFTLQPNTWTSAPPRAIVGAAHLKVQWSGQRLEPAAIKQSLDGQLNEIDKWLSWVSSQVNAYNGEAVTRITREVQARKERILANRNLEAAIGFPIQKRSDAGTYAIPVVRKKIDLRSRPATSSMAAFRPEPVLAEAHYEDAIRVLLNSRNQLERSPSTTAHMGEEAIRDMLLLNLNGQFEGKAAGEVFNGKGKTDILVRVEDRHVFIGECKFWKGPKTITDTLDQLLGYLVWRDTKAALLLFIRRGNPTEIITKSLDKICSHPSFKRESTHSGEFGERYNFVFHAAGDESREIKLAFLPFALLTESPRA